MRQSVTVGLTGVQARGEIGNIGTVGEARDAANGLYGIQVQTPKGARSDVTLSKDSISISIQGPTETGRKGEYRVLDILQQIFHGGGLRAIFEQGKDDYGEDQILRLDDEVFTLQIVTVPRNHNLWHAANTGLATTSGTAVDGASWIRDAILAKVNKTPLAERGKTILVLDAGLAGVLSAPEVLETYFERHSDPRHEFGLAAVLLVGPTTNTTKSL